MGGEFSGAARRKAVFNVKIHPRAFFGRAWLWALSEGGYYSGNEVEVVLWLRGGVLFGGGTIRSTKLKSGGNLEFLRITMHRPKKISRRASRADVLNPLDF